MSKEKKEKVIKVENLVIHAQNVDFIRERQREREPLERDPWEFLMGRPRPVPAQEESSSEAE
ncbi:hypothetical protein QNH23_00845 [Siminovitchia fortis]|uniref:Uncharacterized protein n=1 Tax=Siminovitchia fortis TaxID=254758 RepID=A0A451GCS1_9BACI|nr:hypothetical protein [Siminovitchia fortis]RWR13206.1 hypothetical protein D4N35_005405 [Siminovitchia fortis]WHY82011.1 hypothetical protein QNH23_00845 [Siminovitchia fortis]